MSHTMRPEALKNCGQTNRRENYPTPLSLARMMVGQAILTRSVLALGQRQPVRVLDLCAGNAAWGIIAKQELAEHGISSRLTAIEVDYLIEPAPEVDTWITADFESVDGTGKYDLIFSNPPFSKVYEATQWALNHLDDWGIFTLLIGSNFMFARTRMEETFQGARPLMEMKLTRRPSFKHIFAEKRGDEHGTGTSAKDYCGYYFGGSILTGWFEQHMPFYYLMIDTETKPWVTYTKHWDYEEDPLQSVIENRAVTVQQALIREAAEIKDDARQAFDDDWSLLAANRYGWEFYYADDNLRNEMREQLIQEGETQDGL